MYVVQEAQELQRARSHSLSHSSTMSSISSFQTARSHVFAEGPNPKRPVALKKKSHHSSRAGRPGMAPTEGTHDHVTAKIADREPPQKKHGHAHDGSMNMRALVLHVLGDALGNIGVIATGLIMWLAHFSWRFYFDPIISLIITGIIFASALPLGG